MLTNGPNLDVVVNGLAGEVHYFELMRRWRALDLLVQCSVLDKDLLAPPGSAVDGASYIVASAPTGAWDGHAKHIARWSTVLGAWEFLVPKTGWRAHVVDESLEYRYVGGAWSVPVISIGHGGTGATAADGARTALGLGTAAVLDSDTNAALTANSDFRLATQKAVKAYVDDLSANLDFSISVVTAMLQTGVIDKDLTVAPALPSIGDMYIVAPGATGDWSGHNNNIAIYLNDPAGDPTWVFVPHEIGWRTYVIDEDAIYTFDSGAGAWIAVTAATTAREFRGLTFLSDTGSTVDSDPGAGVLRWNNAPQGASTELYVGDETTDGVSLTSLYPVLGQTGYLYLQQEDSPAKWQVYKWTALAALTGYHRFTVLAYAAGASGVFDNGKTVFAFFVPSTTRASLGEKVQVLTDAATVDVDASLANNFRVTLGGNRTLGNPTNLIDGQVVNFRVLQDGTGSRTLAYSSKYKFPGGTAPVLTTTASAHDFMSCQYDSTDDTLYCVMSKDMK